jgi:hypothetical protein
VSTFATFITRVQRELEEASASVWSPDSYLAWGNDAISDYALKVKPLVGEEYATSVAAQASYALPAGTLEVVSVAYGDAMLSKVSIPEMTQLIVTATSTGTPSLYTLMDGALYLHPAPAVSGDAIRFFRRYRPAEMTSVTATTPMPWDGTMDSALSEYVMSKAYAQIQDFESASFHKGLYESEVIEGLHERVSQDASGGFVGTTNVY